MLKRFAVILTVAAAATIVGAAEAGPASATVVMELDHQRMTVELELRRDDGSWHPARAWVDSGGTEVTLAEPLARALGFDLSAMPPGGGRPVQTGAPVPALRLGGVLLDVAGMTFSVRPGPVALAGIRAECVLPARCLRRLHVVFDYPARRLTVARPGTLAPRGMAVPCRVHPDTGLFMVEATIVGEKATLGVDTGSAGTWMSDGLINAWLTRHRDWPQALGAAGSTNFFGFPFEARGILACLPQLAVGAAPAARDIAVLGLDQGLFDWYSQKSAAPVVGFLGADFIARFRLEVDFPAQMTWWQPGPPVAVRDLDIVPLALRPDADGSYFVAGVVGRGGKALVPGVELGDKLLRVDALDVAGAAMGKVINALRGHPGDLRILLLERAGKRFSVRAAVARLP